MNTDSKYNILRQKAENLLKEKGKEKSQKYFDDIEKLVEELNIHQIELEMQNQELQSATERINIEKLKYIDLYNNAPIAYFTINETGNIYDLNEQAAIFFGLPKHALNKISLFIFLAESSKILFTKLIKQVFQNEDLNNIEIDFKNSKNEINHTKIVAQTYFDNQNNKRLCRCAIIDMTTQIRLQKDVENERNKFKLLTENSFDIINILDKNGIILFESEATERILGYKAGERIGQNTFEYVHPQDIENIVKEFQDLVQKPNTYKLVEFRFKHKDGSWKWLETIGQNYIDNSVINEIIINSRDITERKKTDIQRNYLAAIIQNTENICVIKDLDLKVIATNMSFVKAAGKNSVEELIGKTDAEIFNISTNEEPIKSYMSDERAVQQLKNGEKLLKEEIVIFQDNTIKTYLTSKFPIFDNNSKIIATANISTDITEKVKVRELLKEQNIELVKLNADKDRFIKILAHDLKNPFNAILGFSELLLKNLHKYEINKIEKLLKIINQTTNQTYNLLEDLLLWSKAQSGKFIIEPQKIVFNEICADIINNLKHLADAKEISINCFENKRTILKVDLNMFKTILRNLISNSIKFTNKNGQINIYIEININEATIIVSDNGVGIEKENLLKLWDFSKPISTIGTADEKGTGFGLLVCKEFVEKHNGKIWVESEVGKGSDFKFTMPLCND